MQIPQEKLDDMIDMFLLGLGVDLYHLRFQSQSKHVSKSMPHNITPLLGYPIPFQLSQMLGA